MCVLSMRRPFGTKTLTYTVCIAITLAVAWAVGEGSATTPAILRIFHGRGALFAFSTIVSTPAETALQISVLSASDPLIVTPPSTEINIQANFDARFALPEDDLLVLYLMDAHGTEVARADNDLNNRFTILPTSRWTGLISVITALKVPKLPNGIYTVMAGIYKPTGPLQLASGPGVIQDAHFRYAIGRVRVDVSAPPPALLPSPSLDLTGYHLTFEDSFAQMSISDSKDYDGARWYARNEECCMGTTDGTATAMVGRSSTQNPFSLIPGGGLNIRLQRRGNSWTSGVLTSVDGLGRGFSQQYGYFEMKAKFPSGLNTWPAFWLLSTASKRSGAPSGEIDIVEYLANPGFANYIATTLHNWSDGSAPAASHHRVPLPTAGLHTYGMLWTDTTMTFYFDRAITMRTPTPAIMKQPYYLLVDLGIGSGWPTEKTPPISDMQIQYIRVFSR